MSVNDSFVKKPWPTKDAMSQVYSEHLWGGYEHDFYSGEGSHQPEFVDPYIKAVRQVLASFESPPSVCDLGCGDFHVGQQLVDLCSRYHAVDIVPELIERNKNKFKLDQLEFHCLDLAEDMLPVADCAILRQVLQHLSNREVLSITEKLPGYGCVILTEHLPVGDYEPNLDIISGRGIRLKKGSGVDLLKPPFNLKIREATLLLSIPDGSGKGVIETKLIRF